MLSIHTYRNQDFQDFHHLTAQIVKDLSKRGTVINRNEWQTINTSKSKAHTMVELNGVLLEYELLSANYHLESLLNSLRIDIEPNLPWADDHFEQERVGGAPLNPGKQFKNWPYYKNKPNNDIHRSHGEFSHTYMERIWPKWAGHDGDPVFDGSYPKRGIRYEYGDLDDIVKMLLDNPYTRQAYLPIWFPEDTGARGRRVPCSIGYHFIVRDNGIMDCFYTIRSCDFVRHFRDDVYMAIRLTLWVIEQFNRLEPKGFGLSFGRLNMTISNLHLFQSDLNNLTK